MTNWLPTDATADDLRAVFESFSDDEFEQVRTDWRGLWARVIAADVRRTKPVEAIA